MSEKKTIMCATLKGEFIMEIPDGYDRMIPFSKYVIAVGKDVPPLKLDIQNKKWEEIKIEDYADNIDT